MSAELKKMQTKAREQQARALVAPCAVQCTHRHAPLQVRTQVLMNNIVMLASPLHQLRLADLQKKGAYARTERPFLPAALYDVPAHRPDFCSNAVEEEHQALAALGQQHMLQ